MVPKRYKISVDAVGDAQQKLAASIARPLLEVRGRSRCVQPVGALDNQLNPEPRAHRAHEFFVAICLITANLMIEMRCDDAEAQSLAKIDQRAGKRDRISAAG